MIDWLLHSVYRLGTRTGTGALSFDRDAQTRQLTGVNLSVQKVWPQVDDLRYTYDPAGNITRVVNTQGDVNNGAPTRTQCYAYDALNRLSQAWTATDECAGAPSTAPGAVTVGGTNPYWTSWTFDPIGLRRTQVRHALPGAPGGDTTTIYTYPPSGAGAVRPHAVTATATTGPAGSSTSSYGYNQVGATTSRRVSGGDQSLTWTETNRLATVTGPAGSTSYVYDADGNQLIRRDPGKTTLFLPMQEIVRDSTSGILTGTRYYTHNGTVVAMRVGGRNIEYVQADHHGTNQVSVKAEAIDNHVVTRRDMDPYGNPIGAGVGVWPDAHGFLNKPHNPATGLTDIGARTYDPTLGAFLSVDPILDPASPQQWHAYGYANANPITNSDPTGLRPICGMDEECGYEGAAWQSNPVKADRIAKKTRAKRAQSKLASPVKNKQGKSVPKSALDGLRAVYAYQGSDDFTYADAMVFAAQGDAQWGTVCQWMGGSSDECTSRSDSG